MKKFIILISLIFTTSFTYQPTVRIKLAFVGDLMVHEWQLNSGTFAYFDEVIPYLKDAHFTVGNLETTFAGVEAGWGTYPLFNTPDAFADALKDAGFDMVTTVNNHCMDKGEPGLLRTLDVLDERGIAHIGTYATEEAQQEIYIKNINGIRIAFLAYTYGTNGIPAKHRWQVNYLDEILVETQIKEARKLADIVIVLPHMGDEYEEEPAQKYINLARKMCDWGADAVLASHPHVLQPTEMYNGSFIAYSMGNFISGQRSHPMDKGAIFYLEYEKTGYKTVLTDAWQFPTKVQRLQVIPDWSR